MHYRWPAAPPAVYISQVKARSPGSHDSAFAGGGETAPPDPGGSWEDRSSALGRCRILRTILVRSLCRSSKALSPRAMGLRHRVRHAGPGCPAAAGLHLSARRLALLGAGSGTLRPERGAPPGTPPRPLRGGHLAGGHRIHLRLAAPARRPRTTSRDGGALLQQRRTV